MIKIKAILQSLIKNKLGLILIGLIVFIAVIISFRAPGPEPDTDSDESRIPKVTLLNVKSHQNGGAVINAVGEVESLNQVELKSQISERINRVHVSIGDDVFAGQKIASLNSELLISQLRQAEANLETEQARLRELKTGTRSEELKLQEIKVENAKRSYGEAKNSFMDKLQDAYTKSDDSIRNRTDLFFSNPRSPKPQINFLVPDSQLKSTLEWERFLIENMLISWKISLDQLTTENNFDLYGADAEKNLDQVKSFLDKAALAINSAIPTLAIPQTTINAWKTSIVAARTNISVAITGLSGAEEKLKTFKSSLSFAENELLLKMAGATSEQTAFQEARVKFARANVQGAQTQLAKTVIRSPIQGTVSSIPVKQGNLVNVGETIAHIVNTDGLQIKTYISSENLSLVNEGAKALIEDNIEGMVSRIAPSIDPGTKKVEVLIAIGNNKNSGLVIGQFANVDIYIKEESLQEKDAVFLPLRAIKTTPDAAYVYTLNTDNTVEEHKVSLGRIIGEVIEVTGGLANIASVVDSVRGLRPGDKAETQ